MVDSAGKGQSGCFHPGRVLFSCPPLEGVGGGEDSLSASDQTTTSVTS